MINRTQYSKNFTFCVFQKSEKTQTESRCLKAKLGSMVVDGGYFFICSKTPETSFLLKFIWIFLNKFLRGKFIREFYKGKNFSFYKLEKNKEDLLIFLLGCVNPFFNAASRHWCQNASNETKLTLKNINSSTPLELTNSYK